MLLLAVSGTLPAQDKLPRYLERGSALHLVRGAQKTRGRAVADF
jgi:hypothetical protein